MRVIVGADGGSSPLTPMSPTQTKTTIFGDIADCYLNRLEVHLDGIYSMAHGKCIAFKRGSEHLSQMSRCSI
jgi:hypothetical protein